MIMVRKFNKSKTTSKKSESSKSIDKKTKTSKKILKFAPQSIQDNGKYATYTAVKEAILNKIGNKFDSPIDIQGAIKSGRELDLSTIKPKKEKSTLADAEERAKEQQTLSTNYKMEHKRKN